MRIAFIAALLFLTAPARADTSADIAALMAMLPGTYDNPAQVAADPKMPRLTTYIRAIKAPAFGDNILYLEEIKNGDPAEIARIRLFQFTKEDEQGAIRLHLINPIDAAKLKGAHADLARAAALTPADVRPDRGLCDVFIRRVGDRFEGAMKPKSCDRKDDQGRAVFVAYDLVTDGKTMKVRNRWRAAADDAVVWEQTPGGWLEQVRTVP